MIASLFKQSRDLTWHLHDEYFNFTHSCTHRHDVVVFLGKTQMHLSRDEAESKHCPPSLLVRLPGNLLSSVCPPSSVPYPPLIHWLKRQNLVWFNLSFSLCLSFHPPFPLRQCSPISVWPAHLKPQGCNNDWWCASRLHRLGFVYFWTTKHWWQNKSIQGNMKLDPSPLSPCLPVCLFLFCLSFLL